MIVRMPFLLFVIWTMFVGTSEAAETRCTELGANCVCSEPLQATSYANLGSNAHWNPNDTSTLECNGEGIAGYAVVRNTGGTLDLVASTNTTALSRLPAGHSVSRFLAGAAGHQGTWFTGHNMTSDTTYAQRIAFRFYLYHSSDYNFSNPLDGSQGCNAKLLQLDAGLLGDITHGAVHMYNFTTWTPAQDCCFDGPGPAGNNLARADWLDKWWRIEFIMTNRNAFSTGQHWRMQMYMKNVTDGTAEKLVVDSDEPGTQLNVVNPRIPSAVMNKLLVNHYRGENVGNPLPCVGYEGVSHYMVAGWDTNAGQRIGPAAEIEGALAGPSVKGSLGGAIKAVGGVRLF